MDYFVKEGDFEKAALAAHEVMLQEINDNELTLAASILSCIKCAKLPETSLSNEEDIDEDKVNLGRLIRLDKLLNNRF